jgi:hypothetical protein
MQRTAALTLAVGFALTGPGAFAQTSPDAKTKATKVASRTAPRQATSREALQSEAKGLALAAETAEAVNATQLDIAARVLTGKADCEYSQSVDVAAAESEGNFKVTFKGKSYLMVPEETSTGAIRLVSHSTGMVWLQIPVKSMLLDGREGHRLVDRCTQSEQRAAVAAVAAAAAMPPAAPGK